jgi:diaminohydroxyphosphoribosylaminopyrimidine deaminase / 5-amino-6-(5-phosphoribosylamino)uracil reductase
VAVTTGRRQAPKAQGSTTSEVGAGDPARTAVDERHMAAAIAAASAVRGTTSPNPWVGAVLVTADDRAFSGATEPPGGAHAEIGALRAATAAGASPADGTLYVTLEPCSHHGRTGPCADAAIAAGIARVVVAVLDPDPRVAGQGIARLRGAGVAVDVGIRAVDVEDQLAPYLTHRRLGRPWVTLKLAATLDGRTAAADGSSRWITGEGSRADAHRLRAEHDAVLVGAGTVRTDDPELTVRHVEGRDPVRVVLGHAPAAAKIHPALELQGPLPGVLADLAGRGILSVLVEGGPTVAHAFHSSGLVDRYVMYLAPALMGGSDGRPLLDGPGAATISEVSRCRLLEVRRLGDDVRLDLAPAPAPADRATAPAPPAARPTAATPARQTAGTR